jgi:putative SOS response-associated peptidase YedK
MSEALGISLSEVHDLYFGDMDEVRKGPIIEEAQERRWMDREYEEEREEAVKEERHQELQLYREDTTL